MTRYIEKPNLPVGNVTAAICGELCKELNDYLDSLGVERIVIEANRHIDPATAEHADMAVLHLGEDRIIADKAQTHLIGRLKEKDLTVYETQREIKGEYPGDVALNFTVIGEHIIGNFMLADEVLLNNISHFKKLNVRQGYCKCSCLVINENALITDDKSIYNIASENGLECLLVSKGDISLQGHEYGFIGGASCKISNDEVLFFGDITKHRDYKKIADFIAKHSCKIISPDFPLTDFGGIIPITEKAP